MRRYALRKGALLQEETSSFSKEKKKTSQSLKNEPSTIQGDHATSSFSKN